jgi:hypothetical protein
MNDLKAGTFHAKALYLRHRIQRLGNPRDLWQSGHALLREGGGTPPDARDAPPNQPRLHGLA